MAGFESTEKYWVHKALPSDLYPNAYNLALIESMDELKKILSVPTQFISFDTETNGLNPERSEIVGYSFCMNGKDAYYVAVNHKVGQSNLGDGALDLIYNKLVSVSNGEVNKDMLHGVLMYNMRFDCRMMEWYGYVSSTLSYKERLEKIFFNYDMSKVSVIDVQMLVYLADTHKKYSSLKWCEEWFLGWRGASFEDTLGAAENFEYLDPRECYTYAATDALGTYLVFPKVYPFLEEAKTSGQLDIKSLFPLMRYEQETILIDVDRLKLYSDQTQKEIEEVQNRVWAVAGYPFNIGSPKEKSQVMDRLGISTGNKTARGEWKSGKRDVAKVLDEMDKSDPNYQFLKDLVDYASLVKQKSSYMDNIIEMCDNEFHPNRLRFSYKTTEVPSGRLAAGGDKKNDFFANLNIQNITKPHACDWYYLPLKTVLEHWPKVKDCIFDEGREKRDWFYTNEETGVTYNMTHILGYCFADKPYNIEGVQEYVIEGFVQEKNIRSAFLPDEGRYWVSIDYAAEELRIAALISKEPIWIKTFSENGDVHKSTAEAIWGKENYTKDLRKRAKGANFGILYGMDYHNFADGKSMTLEEAKEFMENYKNTLSTLFKWVNAHQAAAKRNKIVYTYFGRPIRVKKFFESEEYGQRNYGKRLAVNATIQGTGADILKSSFLKLWANIFCNIDNRKKCKFISTVHDEINYNITKQDVTKIVPIIIKNMRMQLPNWEFPIDVGLSIGNKWGMDFDFNFDPVTFQILGPKGDPYIPKPKKKEEPKVEQPKEEAFEFPTLEF